MISPGREKEKDNRETKDLEGAGPKEKGKTTIMAY